MVMKPEPILANGPAKGGQYGYLYGSGRATLNSKSPANFPSRNIVI